MGLHSVCSNPYHRFDREKELEMIYDPDRKCHYLWGVCAVCGSDRIVTTDVLRDRKVIEFKMKYHNGNGNNGHAVLHRNATPKDIYAVMKARNYRLEAEDVVPSHA